nr:polysaccharide pyruvyl transferase family protein [Rhodococcus sp. 06-621-2]
MLLKLISATRRPRVWLLCAVGIILCSLGDLADRLGRSRFGRRNSKSKPAIVLIGAYGNSNFGDDIVAVGISRSVRSFSFSGLTVIGRRENFELLKKDLPDARFVTCGDGLPGLLKTFVSVPRGSGLAILGGGGLLEGRRNDVNVHRLVLEYVLKLTAARIRGYRVGVHGIGISSDFYSSRLVTYTVRRVLRSAAFVNVRDAKSLKACRSVGVEAALIMDPATTVFTDICTQVQTNPGRVAIVLLDHHRWPSFEKGSVETESKRSDDLASLARFMVDRENFGDRFSFFSFHESDKAILDDLLTAFAASGGNSALVEHLERWSSCLEPFTDLMTCEHVYSMRFHPGLAARYARRDVKIVGDLQKLDVLRSGSDDVGNWEYPPGFSDSKQVLLSSLAQLYPEWSRDTE